jgi:UDP-N-acetyl-D-glucosamine dehydrogenase
MLEKAGAKVSYADPYVPEFSLHGKTYRSLDWNDFTGIQMDLALLITDHGKFDGQKIADSFPLILDTRAALRVAGKGKVYRI